MKYRKLRIAWSVVCGILCLLLIVLWVSSYFYVAGVWRVAQGGRATVLMSESGCLVLMRYVTVRGTPRTNWQLWGHTHAEAESAPPTLQPFNFQTRRFVQRSELPFTWFPNANTFYASLPHWAAAFCCGCHALAPCMRPRFSLRTLLIGMTAVAVVLGLIFALSRRPPGV
jgi:hypothetical protein